MVDNEEEFERLCGKCKDESESIKCPSCGDKMDIEQNPTFDESKFEELKRKHGGA